jgi:hypothetical protein
VGLQLNSRRKPYRRPEKRVHWIVLLHNVACFGVTRATRWCMPLVNHRQLGTLRATLSRDHRCEFQTKIARRLAQTKLRRVEPGGLPPKVGCAGDSIRMRSNSIWVGFWGCEGGLSFLYRVATRSQSVRSTQARPGPGCTDICLGVSAPASGTSPPRSQTTRVECD